MKKNNKILYLEILRILAAFFVIFNHTGINGFFLFSKYGVNTITFWLGAFFSIFCKFSVPMFFGISGILLLNKEESIKDIWKNRILKVFITLILISTLFYCYDVFYAKTETFNLITYIKKLYTNGNNIVLWYLYGYMAFLICLPFLRSIVKHLEDKHYYYLIIIAILFNGIIPIIEWLFFKGTITLYYKGEDSHYSKVSGFISFLFTPLFVTKATENRNSSQDSSSEMILVRTLVCF